VSISHREDKEMAKFKVEIVRTDCSGCELCTQTCPDYFEMAADGYSTLKGGRRIGDNDELELDNETCTRDAAADCPVNCIHVYENGTKVI
jgi:ferredoxin